MMLKIGNKAFSLVEVMVATSVLSLGAVLIYEAFFISLDTFNYYSNNLKAIIYIDEKLWHLQDELSRYNTLSATQTSGELTTENKDFIWSTSYEMIDAADKSNLYKIDLALTWKEGTKNVRLSREAYAMYVPK